MPAGGDPPGASARTVTRPAVAMLARSPDVAGKTRLTAHLALPDATALRRALLLDTIAAVLSTGRPLHLFLTPPADLPAVRALIAADRALSPLVARCHLHAQGDGDLGARMTDAMQRTLDAGHDVVVLVGSDLPALGGAAIVGAIKQLDSPYTERSVVFGPSCDGGFYLAAARRAWVEPFAGATWSHAAVLAETEARAEAAGLTVGRVRAGDDVDTIEDLERLLATAPASAAPRTRAWAAARR